ncbi:nucleoside-diphosphate sugar epimerase/dehydratase [Rothia nasimurium]|uniref:nucleoside-diphosphate sugar epimerase/dehydratase n=1 Tax=Rothia nasimurium TaxID=85336 RepID=UPI001F3F7C64|nr:nucleoside-diphosphate sugar epimerase/dehydratase [Rothia nasimurium]
MSKESSPQTTSIPILTSSTERKTWWKYVQMGLDSLAWLIALPAAFVLRYGMDLSQIDAGGLATVALVMVALQIGGGLMMGLYRGVHSYGTLQEGSKLYPLILANTIIMQILLMVSSRAFGVPRSVVLIAFPIAVLLMMGFRYIKRIYEEQTNRPTGEKSEKVIVYGAGFVGRNLVSTLMADPQAKLYPVAIVDDDRSVKNARISGVKVEGTSLDLPALVKQHKATKVLIAIGEEISERRLVKLAQSMKELGVETVRISSAVPDFGEKRQRTKEGNERELLEEIRGAINYNIDHQLIQKQIKGKRVLVTGAGGSIGSELCRQIAKYEPAELMMLDRDESLLMDTRYSLSGLSSLDHPSVVLADVRDAEALEAVFTERKPQVVFHAAALKHVSALEAHPKEAYKTNTLGTANVLKASALVDVEVFVNISTDKAADPTTALGQSKRSAEMLTSWYGQQTGRPYVSVRFGNVFGSRGSIKPLFTKQILDGGPLTVTDINATRYFMLIPDACLLVMLAGAIGKSGEVLVLDMGEPVKIMQVAEHMRRLYERFDVEIRVIGLRPGEKRDEVLFGLDEVSVRSEENEFILRSSSTALDPADLDYGTWLENYRQHRGYDRVERKGQES